MTSPVGTFSVKDASLGPGEGGNSIVCLTYCPFTYRVFLVAATQVTPLECSASTQISMWQALKRKCQHS